MENESEYIQGQDPNGVLKLRVWESILANQVDVRPDHRGMGFNEPYEIFPSLRIFCFDEFIWKVEVVPANNAIRDHEFAVLSDILLMLLDLGEIIGVANSYQWNVEGYRKLSVVPLFKGIHL